jgi:hypothetical protein
MKKKCTYFIFFSLFLYFSLLNMLVNYKSCDWREKSNDYHRTSIEFNIITETEYLQFRRKIRVCQMIFSRSERTEYLELSLVCESEREKMRKMYIIFRESAIAVGKCFLQFHGVWGKADDGMEERKKNCLHISFLGHLTRKRESVNFY